MTAVRAFDPSGAPVHLGKELGRGGEGAVYEINGRPDSVAKIYFKPKPGGNDEKLVVMAAMADPKLLSLAAWPTSTLHGPSGSTLGFVMSKIAGHSPVFKLYGPKLRLQEFPKADWRFLIHAAANTARAFSTVHAAGLVIGDVNHGNLVVGADATVRLIDCDSFQVSKGSRRWFCEVGVGTHQPPEMQLPSYAGVTRTANHDNFGLAVIIFQMLCMGRHPFAGRYLSQGNPPTIEEAIANSQYAYSRDQRRTSMAPPPGSLPIDALSPDVQALFENAFAPSAPNRPYEDQWVTALQQLGASLRECTRNQAHRYLAKLPHCPWCQIEAASGTPLFPVVFVGKGGSAMGIAALWQEVTKIAEPAPLPFLPNPDGFKTSPSPEAVAAAKGSKKLENIAYAAIAAAVLLPLFITFVMNTGSFMLVSLIVEVLAWVVVKADFGKPTNSQPLDAVKRDWDAIRSNWQTSPSRFGQIRRDLDALKARHDGLPSIRTQRMQQLTDQRRQKQLQDYLDQYSITSAKISGIGPAKSAMLASYGIDTAGDIVAHKVMAVPGFGEVTTQRMVVWRQQIEGRFRFDPSKAISPTEISSLERDIVLQRFKIEQDISSGLANLKAIVGAANSRRQALEGQLAELMPRYAQANADAAIAPRNPTMQKSLIALASLSICATLFSLIPKTTPKAASIQPPVQVVTPWVAAPPFVPPPPEPPRQQVAAPSLPPPTSPQVPPTPTKAIGTAQTSHVQTKQLVNMRSAPDNTSPVVRIILQGMVMTAFARRDGWVQVGDDMPWGWIYSGYLVDAP